MAKALFHKNQRVYVKPVGTWAVVEHVMPQWVKDVEEPVRIYYDCGLGRNFTERELSLPEEDNPRDEQAGGEEGEWRLMRAKNKWQDADATRHHPFPGSFPVVVTDVKDWGGWRVPGQEYDRDPYRIERQARIIASARHLMSVARSLQDAAQEHTGQLPGDIMDAAKRAGAVLRYIDDAPAPAETESGEDGANIAAE